MLLTLIITAAAAFMITALLGIVVIPILHKLKFGHTILDIGPAWHKAKKQGTATMGGVMFIIGITAAFAVGFIMLIAGGVITLEQSDRMNIINAVSGIIMAVLFGFIGFVDDFIKVKKKQNEGLTATQKIIMQILVIAAYFTVRVLSGDTSTVINIPFLGGLDLWYFYYILVGLAILYLVNAVNLTDGIDGLCATVTFVVGSFFAVAAFRLGSLSEVIVSALIIGATLGFLIYNAYPAKVFMGDTGSLFLGGLVVAMAFVIDNPLILVLVGIIYVCESMSDILQVGYFKLTHGKRLFKMAPIHHHFERCGWSENKIVFVFSAVTAVFCLIAYFGLKV